MAVRVGFIGTGGIAGAHRRALSQLDNAHMVAFCDIDEERARAAAEEHGGAAFTDYTRMLDDVALDAVYICTPPFAHGDFEQACIDRGLPMFVEKPVDVDLARAKRTLAGIQAKGLLTGVGYHWRAHENVDWLRGEIGEQQVGFAMGYWFGNPPRIWWWRKWEAGGGQMVEQCTHITDLARFLMGEVTTVFARYTQYYAPTLMEDFEVADAGGALLTFANGSVASINTTCAILQSNYLGLQVHFGGSRATINVNGTVSLAGGKFAEEVVREPGTNAMQREDRFFIDALDGVGDPAEIRSDYADALQTLAVTLAMNESARTGQIVDMASFLGQES